MYSSVRQNALKIKFALTHDARWRTQWVMNTKRLHLRIDSQTKHHLEVIARRQGRSISDVIRRLVRRTQRRDKTVKPTPDAQEV